MVKKGNVSIHNNSILIAHYNFLLDYYDSLVYGELKKKLILLTNNINEFDWFFPIPIHYFNI